MIEDLTDVGAGLEDFAEAYVVTRAGAVEFDTEPGRPTLGAPSTVNITAVVWPPTTRDLQRMPEGLRTDETRVGVTRTALVKLPAPDLLALEGGTWQVETVEPWTAGGYYRFVARKVG
jgi:hypothetical protein